MIKYIAGGNIFESGCEALVNPVNCVGVMGAGLALQFKDKFPKMYLYYRKLCENKLMYPGEVVLSPKFHYLVDIINFPTKNHWKDKSDINVISKGLNMLRNVIVEHRIKSIAIPALGCGLGGLSWELVKSQIDDVLYPISNGVIIKIYEPQ